MGDFASELVWSGVEGRDDFDVMYVQVRGPDGRLFAIGVQEDGALFSSRELIPVRLQDLSTMIRGQAREAYTGDSPYVEVDTLTPSTYLFKFDETGEGLLLAWRMDHTDAPKGYVDFARKELGVSV